MGWEHIAVLEKRLDALEEKIADMKVQITHVEGISGSGCYIKAYTTKEYLFGYQMRVTDGTVSKTTSIIYDNDNENYTGELVAPFSTNITIRLVKDGVVQATMATTCNVSAGYSVIDLDALIDANITEILKTNDVFFASCCEDSHFVDNDSLFPTLLAGTYEKDKERKNVAKFFNTRSDNTSPVTKETFVEIFADTEALLSLLDNSDFILTQLSRHSAFCENILTQRILHAIKEDESLNKRIQSSSLSFSSNFSTSKFVKREIVGDSGIELSGDFLLLSIESGCKGGFVDSAGSVRIIRTDYTYGPDNGTEVTASESKVYASLREAYTVNGYGEDNIYISRAFSASGCASYHTDPGWSNDRVISYGPYISANHAIATNTSRSSTVLTDSISRATYNPNSFTVETHSSQSSSTTTYYYKFYQGVTINNVLNGVINYIDISTLPE